MSVPPPMLAVPPPQIQPNQQMNPQLEQINTVTAPIIQQSNIITQNAPTMVIISSLNNYIIGFNTELLAGII